MYTSCLSFNFLLEILVVGCLGYWSHAGGLLWCLCLLINGFLRIQAKVGGCWILGLAGLDHSVSGIQRLAWYWLLPMYIPTESLGRCFLPQTPSHIYCCRCVTLAIVSDGIWFPIIFSTGISAAIRNAEHLVWRGRFEFVFSFCFFFSLKDVRTI